MTIQTWDQLQSYMFLCIFLSHRNRLYLSNIVASALRMTLDSVFSLKKKAVHYRCLIA